MTRNMPIRAGSYYRCIVVVAQCPLNTTGQIVVGEMRGDLESVACRREKKRRSEVMRLPDFAEKLRKKVREDPGKKFGINPGR